MTIVAEIHTKPKSKALFEHLRTHILEGQFPPGHWLKQADLEARYDASRSEIRAALSTLAERGIVEYASNRGFRVFDRSDKEIAEIVEVIGVLEQSSATSITDNADDDAIDELVRLATEFEDMVPVGSHADLRLQNFRFHSTLNEMGNNALLAQTVRNLRECCVIGPFGRYTTYQGLKESSDEHFAIIDAIHKRDPVLLGRLLKAHSAHPDKNKK